MKDITVRPGIVLIELFDVYMLVSVREAKKHCRYILEINSTAAFLWELLRKGISYEEILASFMERYDIEDSERLAEDICMYIRQLGEKGYLLTNGTTEETI